MTAEKTPRIEASLVVPLGNAYLYFRETELDIFPSRECPFCKKWAHPCPKHEMIETWTDFVGPRSAKPRRVGQFIVVEHGRKLAVLNTETETINLAREYADDNGRSSVVAFVVSSANPAHDDLFVKIAMLTAYGNRGSWPRLENFVLGGRQAPKNALARARLLLAGGIDGHQVERAWTRRGNIPHGFWYNPGRINPDAEPSIARALDDEEPGAVLARLPSFREFAKKAPPLHIFIGGKARWTWTKTEGCMLIGMPLRDPWA